MMKHDPYYLLPSCVRANLSLIPPSRGMVWVGRAMSMSEETPSTRSQALGTMGAVLLGVIGIAVGPSPSMAASTADANKRLSA